MKAVFLDTGTFGENFSFDALKKLPIEWSFFEATESSEVGERVEGFDIVVTNKVVLSKDTLQKGKGLKLICVTATGYNNIDLKAAGELNITVCNSPAYSTASVAQLTITFILNFATSFMKYSDDAKRKWAGSDHFCLLDHPLFELAGKKLGIIGYGATGQEVGRLARAFGMEILVAAHTNPSRKIGDSIPLEEVLGRSDFITIHTPLTDLTRNLIGADQLKLMKKSAFLIQMARGGIVNEDDLATALREGVIAGAGLDVLSMEPPKKGHPLLEKDIPNLFLTPHIAWASIEARKRLITILEQNILGFLGKKGVNTVRA